jgi:hypothetical protein
MFVGWLEGMERRFWLNGREADESWWPGQHSHIIYRQNTALTVADAMAVYL